MPPDRRELFHFGVILPDRFSALIDDQVTLRVRAEEFHEVRGVGGAEVAGPIRIIHRVQHSNAASARAKVRRELFGKRGLARLGLSEN